MEHSEEINIYQKYRVHLDKRTANSLTIKLALGLLILSGFILLDLFVIQFTASIYSRLLPLSIGVILLFIHFGKPGPNRGKTMLYHFFLFSLTAMMYANCLIYLDHPLFNSVVTGLILVIFLVSMDIRTNMTNTLFVYFVPPAIFASVLLVFFDITQEQYVSLANVLPMVVLGFLLNRINKRVRYDLFMTNYALRLSNDKLSQYTNELEKTIKGRDRLLSIISHDLRSPFNALMGFTEIMSTLDPKKHSEQFIEYAKSISKASKALYSTTDNLLHWALSQTDKVQLHPGNILVDTLIGDAMDVLKIQAKAKGVLIHKDIASGLTVKGDQSTLLMVFRNLLSNAIKFTRKGDKIDVRAFSEKQHALISVADTGVGIPPYKLNVLFKLEESFSTEGTAQERGTGLGLILCKEFVTMNHGDIFADSTVGQGTVFTVRLPLGDFNK